MATKKSSRSDCSPCHEGTPALAEKEILSRLKKLKNWRYLKKRRVLRVDYRLKDFTSAVHHIQKIARIAEQMGHHPDIHLTQYRHLAIEISTHSISAVSAGDFILAAEIEKIFSNANNIVRV